MTAIPALSEGFRPINSTNAFLQTTARLEKLYQRYRALTKQCTVKHRDAVLQGGSLSFSLAHKLFFFADSRDEKCSQHGDCLACGIREFGSETMEPSLGHCSQTHLLMKY